MTHEKYRRLKQNIDDLLPARTWLLMTTLATPNKKTVPHIIFKTPNTTYISSTATIGSHTVIDGIVRIRGASNIGHHCIIDNAHLTNAHIGNYAFIGPYAQINESEIGDGTDIPHHSYIGNASIGRYCNIGDAVTTSNFDGINKHLTIIEDGCFIGTQMKIVPPVIIGRESFVAVRELKRDIPPHSFVVQGVHVRDGRLTLMEIIKPNRSFMLMPGKWLWTKKPIEPTHMKEFLEKINEVFENSADAWWGWLTTRNQALGNAVPLNLLKNGEEGVWQISAILGRIEHGVYS